MNDEQLILSLRPTVKRVAAKIHRGLPKHVELEDLVSVGMLGAMRAIELYSPDHGVTLDQFAALKVKGAILDELRRQDYLSRSHRAQLKKTGQEPPAAPLSLDAPIAGIEKTWSPPDPDSQRPTMGLEAKLTVRKLVRRSNLNQRESYVVRQHLLFDWTLGRIGERLGFSESRASQILRAGLAKLRATYQRKAKRDWIPRTDVPTELLWCEYCRWPFLWHGEIRRGKRHIDPRDPPGWKRRFCSHSCVTRSRNQRQMPPTAVLRHLYETEGLSLGEIAQLVGFDKGNIHKDLQAAGVKMRTSGGWSRAHLQAVNRRRQRLDWTPEQCAAADARRARNRRLLERKGLESKRPPNDPQV